MDAQHLVNLNAEPGQHEYAVIGKMVMDYMQCCIDCGFHFFEEDKCPNCSAERIAEECESEWNRQLRLLERFTCIRSNDDFWLLWDFNWFRTICQQVCPEIYNFYLSLEIEQSGPEAFEHFPGEQLELSLNELA